MTAGYKTWLVAPQTGELKWAQGTVPTPQGGLVSRWARGDGDRSFTLTVSAPAGRRGRCACRCSAARGRSRWTAPWSGRTARRRRASTRSQRDGAVEFSGVTGSHTFAFGTVTTDVPGTVGGTRAGDAEPDARRAGEFGAFTPGVAKEYTASTTANVISTAGDAALSVADPSAWRRPSGQRRVHAAAAAAGRARNAAHRTAYTRSRRPVNLLTAPVSNDAGDDRRSSRASAPTTRCAPAPTARR